MLVKPRIVNLVVTVDLGRKLDLGLISKLEGCEYEPEFYPCAYFSLPTMVGRVSVFGSGKLISVGTRSVSQARGDLFTVVDRLRREGISVPAGLRIKLRNVVARFDIGHPIDLTRLHLSTRESTYDPGGFPAVIWRPSSVSASFLFFRSGRGMVTTQNLASLHQIRSSLSKKKFPWPNPLGGPASR